MVRAVGVLRGAADGPLLKGQVGHDLIGVTLARFGRRLDLSPDEKLAAKRANEGTRALAGLLNNLAVGTLIAGFLSPWVAGHPEPIWAAAILLVSAIGLHLGAQVVLRLLLKSEE